MQYPLEVTLEDGTTIRTNEETWQERHLVIETDRSERDVRNMLYKEGFKETSMEYPKSGRLGHGMVKEFKNWQVHVRLYRHNDNIQIDGEVEVSKKYVEHLTYDWLPAFDFCAHIIRKHFGGFWVFHEEYGQYATNLGREIVLSLGDPKSKTNVAMLVAGAGLIGLGLLAALSKK